MADKKKTSVGHTSGVGKSEALPESQNFGDPQRQLGIERLAGCHVNGEPIEDWAKLMPEEIVSRMSYPLTDEGMAEQKRIARDREMRLPLDGVARDPEDKKIVQYRDHLADDDMIGLVVSDPMKVLMQRHTPAGHRGLFMSERKVRESGMLRGVVEYQKVLVKNPETGNLEPVKSGDMFLASVPEDIAVRGDRYYERMAIEKLVSPQEKVLEKADEVLRQGGHGGAATRRGLLDRLNAEMADDGEKADLELMQGRFATAD